MAVNYIHKNSIVHRDIKPENVIFQNEKELRLKLIDFGTAQKFVPGQFMIQQYGTPYYMAPEVIKGCYNEKCDLWSVGVILYILLTNEPPFQGDTDAEILHIIVSFKTFMFEQPAWKSRSIGAMDLVKKLLQPDFNLRINAEQALEHPWLIGYGAYTIQKAAISKALKCFLNFKKVGLLQKAVLNYIVTEIFSQRDKDNFLKIYYSLNRSCNGMLTRNELLQAYWSNGFAWISEIELDKILSFVDQDGNGFVTFQEFLAASVAGEDILTPSKLNTAFKAFDKDRSGTIDVVELKESLASYANIPEDLWDAVLREVDDDASGKINLEEFITMLKNIFR